MSTTFSPRISELKKKKKKTHTSDSVSCRAVPCSSRQQQVFRRFQHSAASLQTPCVGLSTLDETLRNCANTRRKVVLPLNAPPHPKTARLRILLSNPIVRPLPSMHPCTFVLLSWLPRIAESSQLDTRKQLVCCG